MTSRQYRIEYRYLPEDPGWPKTSNAVWRAYTAVTMSSREHAELVLQRMLRNHSDLYEYRVYIVPVVWLITDTHFGHKGIVNKGYRPCGFEQDIRDNWKRLVMPEDTIYHLGDVCLGNAKEMHAAYIEPMPGHKVLLRGNHDEKDDDWYLRHGWNEVHEAAEVWSGATRVLLSHYPHHETYGFHYNLFGHLHTDDHRLSDPNVVAAELGPRHLRLALEWMNYSPVTLEDALTGKYSSAPETKYVYPSNL